MTIQELFQQIMAEQEKSIGKKILGLFIKEESSSGSNVVAPVEPVKTTAAPSQTAPRSYSRTGEIDVKFIKHFVDLFEKSNLPGPDYFEFRETLKSLEGLDLPEDKRFQAAWATFKTMSNLGDPQVVLSTANQYIQILEGDRNSFLKDADKAISDRVGSLTQEQQKLKSDNENFARQIIELQNKIQTNNDRLGQIVGEIDAQSAKINENKSQFEATYENFVGQIHSDIERIRQYVR